MSEDKKYSSIEELFDVLEKTYGHQFKEYDVNHRLDNPNNKGSLGQIVEEGILGYSINSNPDEDLANLGLEVKTTGVIVNKNGTFRAKERLTIDTINYNKDVNIDFNDSNVWHKVDDILFVFYNYVKDLPYGDFRIVKAAINSFSEEDKEILKSDYDVIINKIREGHAEDISEGDTMYLGACTAGTGALQSQPFASTKAKQRKFCLKEAFFTQIVRKAIEKEELKSIISIDALRKSNFEVAFESVISKYYGWSESKIRDYFKIKTKKNAKNRYERYIAAMLNVHGDINNSEEFTKANIKLKTIRVQANNKIEQSMSFPYFEFKDIVSQDWEDSDVRNMFATQKFLLVIFKEVNGEMVFERTMFWNMKETMLDNEVKKTYDDLKKVLIEGNIVSKINVNKLGKEIRYNNFPGMDDNEITHIRPHGRDAKDCAVLPVPDKLTGAKTFTKQCFWLNNSFVLKIISKK